MQSFLRRVEKFDSFGGAADAALQRSAIGAAITVISGLCILWLFISELIAYRTVLVKERVVIDPAYGSSQIPVDFKLSMYRMKCKDLNIDIDSSTGMHDIHVSDSMQKTPFVDPAESSEHPEKYATPALMAQHAPGCTVTGRFSISKVAGNFHIALGKNLNAVKGKVAHTQDAPRYQFSLPELTHFNTSHMIHHISFGERLDASDGVLLSEADRRGAYPLDGAVATMKEGASTAKFQYFIKVVPTAYTRLNGQRIESNSFSVTEQTDEVKLMNGGFILGGKFPHPGVFFKYDFSPIMVEYFEERKSFWQFLTSACAIIGGVFTCAGLCTRCLIGAKELVEKID